MMFTQFTLTNLPDIFLPSQSCINIHVVLHKKPPVSCGWLE